LQLHHLGVVIDDMRIDREVLVIHDSVRLPANGASLPSMNARIRSTSSRVDRQVVEVDEEYVLARIVGESALERHAQHELAQAPSRHPERCNGRSAEDRADDRREFHLPQISRSRSTPGAISISSTPSPVSVNKQRSVT
jgi:hypothetical protein